MVGQGEALRAFSACTRVGNEYLSIGRSELLTILSIDVAMEGQKPPLLRAHGNSHVPVKVG